MIKIRRSDERGHANHGWLDTYHSFSFASYGDPQWMQFRSLRVINEDWIDAGQGFGTHPHDNMEIITYVLEGEIAHKDSMGNGSTLPTHGVQRMTAGTGITHSEFNPSDTNRLHLLQIWLLPAQRDLKPSYEDGYADPDATRNRLLPLVVGEGHDARASGGESVDVDLGDHKPLMMHQDAVLYASRLDAGNELTHGLNGTRNAWLQLIEGELEVNGEALSHGDAVAISEEEAVTIKASQDAHFLLFDLG